MADVMLRFPAPDDGPALFAAVRESLDDLMPWMSWCHPEISQDEIAGWIAAQPALREAGAAFEFVIVGEQGRLLGCCGLNAINAVHHFANLGYWVRASEVGRGVATAAVRRLAGWAFAHTDLERLEIVAAVGNLASQRVAVTAGARREGLLASRLAIHGTQHDAVMHAIVRSQWPPGASPARDGPA